MFLSLVKHSMQGSLQSSPPSSKYFFVNIKYKHSLRLFHLVWTCQFQKASSQYWFLWPVHCSAAHTHVGCWHRPQTLPLALRHHNQGGGHLTGGAMGIVLITLLQSVIHVETVSMATSFLIFNKIIQILYKW